MTQNYFSNIHSLFQDYPLIIRYIPGIMNVWAETVEIIEEGSCDTQTRHC